MATRTTDKMTQVRCKTTQIQRIKFILKKNLRSSKKVLEGEGIEEIEALVAVAVNPIEVHVVAQEVVASKEMLQIIITTKSLVTEKMMNKILDLINSIAIKECKNNTKLQ